MLSKHETLGLYCRCGILLWFPSQNRMFLVRKPYVFGTENVKGRLLETDVLFTFATYCASNTITNRTGFSIIFGGKVKGIKKPALHREPVSLCKEIIEISIS